MSELRIALVAEGPTDQIIIEAALKAILPNSFVLTLLQPESTRPDMGNGWGGVFKWCRALQRQGFASLEDDVTLGLFDLIIIHLDADVADKSYADYGQAMSQAAANLPTLPCSQPCPPPSTTVSQLKSLLLAWLGLNAVGTKTVFCIPSKASEAWLASAVFQLGHTLHSGIECNMNLENHLSRLPKGQKIRKSSREYRTYAQRITAEWGQVCERCSQANAFHQDIMIFLL
jgi:hypothetical protein